MEMLGRHLPWEFARGHAFHVTLALFLSKHFLLSLTFTPRTVKQSKRGKLACKLPACSKKSFSSVDMPTTGISEDD